MPNVVTHFTNSLKNTDRVNGRLKPVAFIHPDRSEISVVCIDEELKQQDADDRIFSIGDLIYRLEPKVKARGDMNVSDIEKVKYGENFNLSIFVEHAPTEDIPNHYNIKPELYDLEFANLCSYGLSRVSKLVIKE